MLSPEMQVILGVALSALSIALIWALWQRTARRSVTALLLSIGALLVLVSSGPVLWWQISSRLQSTTLQPLVVRDQRVIEPMGEEESSYTDMRLRASPKWARLTSVLNPEALPSALGALDEAFYDYITVGDGESVSLVLVFVIINEESLRQYQSAGGHPQELGLVGAPLPVPSLLVVVHAINGGIFHLAELSLSQTQGGEQPRRVALRDLALGEELSRRAPWMRLKGSFPQFPNLLAHVYPNEQLIGLVRLPREFDPNRSLQIHYGSFWAALLQNQ